MGFLVFWEGFPERNASFGPIEGMKIHISGYFQTGIIQKDLARGKGMLAIVGVVVVRLSVVGGYLLEGGSFMVFMQFVESIIIGGAAAGALGFLLCALCAFTEFPAR